jgi:hypothetical protein
MVMVTVGDATDSPHDGQARVREAAGVPMASEAAGDASASAADGEASVVIWMHAGTGTTPEAVP